MLRDLELGDSVAVDGVCLTVTQILPLGFVAAASPETLSRTTLGRKAGSTYANLETSLRVGSKLAGHFVTGHVDGMGQLEALVQVDNSWEMSFVVSDTHASRYIVPKGSIAINGISLTVADCNTTGSWFKVAVIPLTYAETNLRYLQPGNWVNLEGDILGKYVEKFLRLDVASYPARSTELKKTLAIERVEDLTANFLAEHGYL